MPQYMTWSRKESGLKATAEFKPLYERLKDELNGIGHQLECNNPVNSLDGKKECGCMKFLLADRSPLAVAYVEATKWVESKSTEFLLGVRHFSDINSRFESLEEIAIRYGFTLGKPFSSKT